MKELTKQFIKEFADIFIQNHQLTFSRKNEIINWVDENISIPVELPVMQKTADEPLPCPFCGGEASIGTTRISDPMTAKLNNRTNGFFVNCKICGANNNCLHLGYATKEIAQHYWNTRK